MRKEQITVTNNSVCNDAENKDLEGKGMKRRLLHFKKRMVPAVSGALMGVMLIRDDICYIDDCRKRERCTDTYEQCTKKEPA